MRHAPPSYICPFCRIAAGQFDEHVLNRAGEVLYRDELVVAFMAAGQFSARPDYPGHVLVIPTQHFENIYELPDEVAARIGALARRVALAFKRLGCAGTSTRQHNEPAGNQDVWHYHLHVFPRWKGDGLYFRFRLPTSPEVRARQAEQLRPHLRAVLQELPLVPQPQESEVGISRRPDA